MDISITQLVIIVLAPLLGSILAGIFGKVIGRIGAHVATIAGVGISCALSIGVLWNLLHGAAPVNHDLYTWFDVGGLQAHVGFMVDNLTAMMMVVVTFVSLLVHVYTIGYMADDDGYQRFFSYISLFTFSMLMLVMSNNFVQLFFGWEAVGLVSYLLIGFWFKRPTAIFANLKAFLVNRVGDFGFLLGIAGIVAWIGTLDYATAFHNVDKINGTVEILRGHPWSMATVISICLFIGAMGKSAQVPLHVWLPDSMEGPTPISALIHAATMVTAGIFMVARMSPIFNLSPVALDFILVIGATTAFFTGLIGIVQNDIKRVIAYSTLSQLGYMTVALGVSAYSAAVFHLMTHAFFKALLFLAAGSVIIGMHHEQDMRRMGGLRKYMPVTFWTSLVGTLALIGTPFFAGFYSKDSIIDAAKEHAVEHGGFIAQYGYYAVLLGAFVTSFYSFRLLYLTFFGKERFREVAHDDHHGDHAHGHDDHGHAHEPHESPWVVTLPLILLAIPSIVIGYLTIGPMLHGKTMGGEEAGKSFFDGAIQLPAHGVMAKLGEEFHGSLQMALHGFTQAPFWLTLAGFALATWMYLLKPEVAAKARKMFALPVRILEDKYGFDKLWINGFAGGSVLLGRISRWFDSRVIDDFLVNGAARETREAAAEIRKMQTGYLYSYAFAMIIGLILLLAWLIKSGAGA
ncbi:MAG: NADH-quinone oxidoreductase subunit L [Proteobacteria bacterium]|nr:NADH-quinone oxidoreductase subunit L [Pseudomonadota bacterium]